jgi:hypothetical protein
MTDLATDLPFVYVSIPPVTARDNNVVLIDAGADFHCRRFITGQNSGPGGVKKIQVFDRLRRSQTGLLTSGANNNAMGFAEWALAPEVVYKGGDSIVYDVDASNYVNPIVMFNGVRRFGNRVNPLPYRKGNWMERPYSYQLTISNNFGVNAAIGSFVTNQSVEIRDYDFELRRILIADVTDQDIPVATSVGGLYSYIIQNSNGQQMMNTYVPDWALGSNCNVINNCFPIPGIIYQVGSLIRVQATNLFATGEIGNGVRAQVIYFDGVQRFPCA